MPKNHKPVRPIRVDGDVAYITLTKGHTAVIDAADVHLVEGRNWSAVEKRNSVYAMRRGSAAGETFVPIQLHRLLMGHPKGIQVDHRDGNGLNNRRANLRLATHAENMRNQRKPVNNTSGIKGVSWSKSHEKWRADIWVNNQQRNIGFFPTKDQAAEAYAVAAADLHGEFANLG